jgi:hypothetical protein
VPILGMRKSYPGQSTKIRPPRTPRPSAGEFVVKPEESCYLQDLNPTRYQVPYTRRMRRKIAGNRELATSGLDFGTVDCEIVPPAQVVLASVF